MPQQILVKTDPSCLPKQESDLFAWLHGKVFYLNGIHGILERFNPGERPGFARLYHNPSALGMQTSKYKALKREMGADWVTDLTDQVECYVDIAISLGYCFEEEDASAPPL